MGIGKILVGIILVIIGLWAIIPKQWFGFGLGWYSQLITVIMGVLPAFLIFIGAVLVWIESEELKISKPKRKRKR
jgi:amino acid transporter